jgi:hypothetical protein
MKGSLGGTDGTSGGSGGGDGPASRAPTGNEAGVTGGRLATDAFVEGGSGVVPMDGAPLGALMLSVVVGGGGSAGAIALMDAVALIVAAPASCREVCVNEPR